MLGGQKAGKKKWSSLSWQSEEGSNLLILEKLTEKPLQVPLHWSFKDSRIQQILSYKDAQGKGLRLSNGTRGHGPQCASMIKGKLRGTV